MEPGVRDVRVNVIIQFMRYGFVKKVNTERMNGGKVVEFIYMHN
ncbi:hypothetical protein [Caldivirga maquilingensis]|nr:hypothetical protein [Caldivirga maquilingensis]